MTVTSGGLWAEELEPYRQEARDLAEAVVDAFVPDGPGEADVERQREVMRSLEVTSPAGRDEVVGGVPCRVFGDGTGRATYLHFHGGAMMLGSPLMNDVGNAAVAEAHGVDVVSVDYRLAPEHPYPAGSDDCLAVARALVEADDRPIVVGGESAGGYFAALTALRMRDELGAAHRLAGANLVYGVYDLSATPARYGMRPSDVVDVLPDAKADDGMRDGYAPGMSLAELRDPKISPLWNDLHDMPPALFTVGTADHLLDDSLFMHARWRAYGNEAELDLYPDCVHGFNGFPMEMAKVANRRIDDFLGRRFERC
jgi:acetyl esterase/lipase